MQTSKDNKYHNNVEEGKMREFPLVLQLDVGGVPNRWITHEDAAYYYSKGAVAWSMGSDDHTLFGGTRRIDGEQSTLTFNTIIAIRGQVLAKSAGRAQHAPALTNRALFRRDRNICGYCGDEFTTAKLTRDHIVPQSTGGPDVWTNCVTACGPCNRKKEDKSLKASGLKLLYVPYTPCRSEFLILMNRNILADQMDFLLKQITNKDSRVHD